MKRRDHSAGFSALEILVGLAIFSVVLALTIPNYLGIRESSRLRYGTVQVAADLRLAQELARAERYEYTVTFTAGSANYVVTRTIGGYNKTLTLPDGVTIGDSDTKKTGKKVKGVTFVVTFSGFGRPDDEYTITVENSAGAGTVSVNAIGGVNQQLP